MKACILLVILCLASLPMNCFALQNPVDHAGDMIKQNTNTVLDDSISKIKIEAEHTKTNIKEGIKSFIKTVLSIALEIFTVIAIGWTLSFLVGKTTAKMVKLMVILCAITQIIKTVHILFGE